MHRSEIPEGLGAERLRAGRRAKPTRQERTRRVRRLAVTWTVVAFAAVWGVIFTQMRAGADPALGAGAPAVAATTGTTSEAAATEDAIAATDATATYDDGTATTTDESAASDVTTSQS
ncbi:hypothetical protein DSM112329_01355 [Paraconexibacter sp. AEG42_29]|uniref:Uncharacterized protein n=1 Tax=Paraconexibacter sp. AEG42_29 TaxID=2997339 RepID=A0AAU7ASP3_9ACTN